MVLGLIVIVSRRFFDIVGFIIIFVIIVFICFIVVLIVIRGVVFIRVYFSIIVPRVLISS